MIYIIGIILILIVLYIIGYFVKRKNFTYIDRLEAWKIELMNRPVLDEVSKIKKLKMAGETEEYFERWRTAWDEIVTEELPNVEEMLYEAEDLVEKYRFSKAKQVYTKIETSLKEAEMKIDEMVANLHDIIGSEEKNREDIIGLQELYKKLKKELLAHQYAYGKASKNLEQQIVSATEKMDQFGLETENGNYLTAREIIMELKKELESLNVKMESIPLLLNECLHVIPEQLKEIKNGINEMVEEGYHLEHLGLSAVIKKLEDTLQSYTRSIETAEIDGIEDGLKEIKGQIEVIYDLLEGEVTAKKYVLSNQSQITESLANITAKNESLKNEVEQVKETYHMSEAELEILSELEEKTATMKKMAELMLTNENLSSAAYSVLRDKVEEIFANMKEVEDKQQSLLEILQALRKDEMEAREKIKNLRKLFQDTARLLERSNLPGVPQDIETKLLDAQEVIQDCFNSLDEKPLRMQFVQTSLQKAESIVNDIHNQVVEMVENVYFIEKIIQYGNRYRRKYPAVHKRLTVAEEAFRRYDYSSAFEEAAAAVEEAEPGALKKIEELINEEYEQDVH
jgi:septation ring formation regulator